MHIQIHSLISLDICHIIWKIIFVWESSPTEGKSLSSCLRIMQQRLSDCKNARKQNIYCLILQNIHHNTTKKCHIAKLQLIHYCCVTTCIIFRNLSGIIQPKAILQYNKLSLLNTTNTVLDKIGSHILPMAIRDLYFDYVSDIGSSIITSALKYRTWYRMILWELICM